MPTVPVPAPSARLRRTGVATRLSALEPVLGGTSTGVGDLAGTNTELRDRVAGFVP